MATNVCSRQKAQWKPVKVFQEYYSLSKPLAYKIVKMQGFPMKYFGEKTIRVDMNRTDDFMDKTFNN